MSLVFEEAYGDSLNYIRLDRNAKEKLQPLSLTSMRPK